MQGNCILVVKQTIFSNNTYLNSIQMSDSQQELNVNGAASAIINFNISQNMYLAILFQENRFYSISS